MYAGNRSRIIPVILIMLVVAIAIAALVSIGRSFFSGGNGTGTQQQRDTSREALLDTSPSRAVRMTVRGPLVANEDFRSYRVTVDQNTRNMTTYSGYLDQPIDSEQRSNNQKAYEEFVYALDKSDMVAGEVPQDQAQNDTRGICATGRVYEFETLNDGQTVKRLWTSTCSGSPGTLRANVSLLERLFKDQIPDSQKYLRKIEL